MRLEDRPRDRPGRVMANNRRTGAESVPPSTWVSLDGESFNIAGDNRGGRRKPTSMLLRRIAAGFRVARLLSAASTMLLASACVRIDPRADYTRASDLIREHVGASDSYDPTDASEVSSRVEGMLRDGLSVDDAVSIALLYNRHFQSLFEGIGVSRADLAQSGLLSNPSLALSIRFPDGGGRSNLAMGFAQQIADLWQIPVRKRIAEAELEQTVLGVVDQALSLSATVKTDYFRLAELLRAESLAGENLALVEKVVELAKVRFEAGEVGQVDVNIAQSDLLHAQIEMMTLARDRDLARTALARDLGLVQSQDDLLLIDGALEIEAINAPTNSLFSLAVQRRVDAQVAASMVRAAETEVVRQYRSVFPSIMLGLEAERPERRALPGRNVLADTVRGSVSAGRLTAPNIQSRAERDLERRQIIDLLLGPSLDVTLPLWDQNQAQIARSKFLANQKRKEFEDLLDSIAREVDDAVTVRDAAEKLVEFYETQAVPHARTTVEAARAAYAAGEEPVLVVLQAQQSLKVQQRAQVAAMRELAQASAELELAIGGQPPVTSQQATDDKGESSSELGNAHEDDQVPLDSSTSPGDRRRGVAGLGLCTR